MQLKKWFMATAPLTQYSLLILRVLMGILFIYHGHELFSKPAMQEFADWLEKDLHFPQPLFMAYLRTGAELFGGIMLVLGCCTRLGGFPYNDYHAGSRFYRRPWRFIRGWRNRLCLCSHYDNSDTIRPG